MDRYTGAVDIYSVLKPVFFLSKILGLSPYNVVGDIGSRRIIVNASAILHNLGMVIVNSSVSAFIVLKTMHPWENICNSGENVLCIGTLCNAISAYFTSALWGRQTGQQFLRLNKLVGKTYYSVWKKDLKLLLAVQTWFVIVIIIAIVVELSDVMPVLHEFYNLWGWMFYYVSDLASLTAEHQFIAIIYILKRTVQNWNKFIAAVSETEGLINDALYRKQINRQESHLFAFSNNSMASNRAKNHSKVLNFVQLRELHATACDIAETVNAIYSPMLLVSIARSFISLTHILYYILINFVVQKTSFYCNITANNGYFLWLIIYSLKLLLLVYVCNVTAKEMNRTAVVVHKLMGKTNDPALKEQLQQFSLQLLHRKVQFTACGFFTLDFTLLNSIVGAVATYLLIMIQFQLALSDSSKNTSTTTEASTMATSSTENYL